MSDAADQSNPLAVGLPDDLDADVFVPGRVMLDVLLRRFPKKPEPWVARKFFDAVHDGDIKLQDGDGNIVPQPARENVHGYGLDDDDTFLVHPVLQKVPARMVSWRDSNRLFPPEETPVDARMKLLYLIPNDVWRYLEFVHANRGDESWTKAVDEKDARAELGISPMRRDLARALFAPADKKRAGRRRVRAKSVR